MIDDSHSLDRAHLLLFLEEAYRMRLTNIFFDCVAQQTANQEFIPVDHRLMNGLLQRFRPLPQISLLSFSEQVDHQLIQLGLLTQSLLEKLDPVILLILHWNQARKPSRLSLYPLAQQVYNAHEIPCSCEIVRRLYFRKVLHLHVDKLLLCEMLSLRLVVYFLLTLRHTMLRLYFRLPLHYIQHRLLVFLLVLLLGNRLFHLHVFHLFPTSEVRYEVVMPREVKMVLDVVLLFGKDLERDTLKKVLFGVEVGTGLAEPLTIGRKLFFMALFEEQLFHQLTLLLLNCPKQLLNLMDYQTLNNIFIEPSNPQLRYLHYKFIYIIYQPYNILFFEVKTHLKRINL